MTWWMIVLAVLALAVGIWIGVGAPGWPHKPSGGRRHRETRPINPIGWGRKGVRQERRPRR